MLSFRPCTIVVVTTLLLTGRGSAQALPSGEPPTVAARWVALRPAYHVRLESAWPAPAGETETCNNRAFETLVGTLRRVGPDRYEGRFARRTRLGFCGTHGPAIERCGAVLQGEGEVAAVGRIVPDRRGPQLSLVWQPVPETTRIRVDGSCAPRFTAALGEMYRTAIHSVDFAVPSESPQKVVLDDYGRMLEIR